MRKRKSFAGAAASVLLCLALLTGCGKTIVWTTQPVANRIMSIGNETVTKAGTEAEWKAYYLETIRQYEDTFGSDVWDRAGNEGLDKMARENALAMMTKVKVYNVMAAERGVTLTDREAATAEEAGLAYLQSMDDAAREELGLGQQSAETLVREYALAEKMYEAVLAGVSSEVSDDEARSVQAQSILIRTYRTDADGNRVEFTQAEKLAAKQHAEEIRQEIRDGIANLTGVTFDTYMTRYSDGPATTVTLTRDDADSAYAEAAFGMDVGTISDVVETDEGYRIIKCIGGYDREQLEENKKRILKERRETELQTNYDAFAQGLETHIDTDAVYAVTRQELAPLKASSFQQMYEIYYKQ